MTVRGLVYLAIEALLFVLSLGTAVREIWICFICISAAGAFSVVSAFCSALFLRLNASLSAPKVPRGCRVDFVLSLTGTVLFPNTVSVEIGVPGEKREFVPCVFRVMPGFRKKTFSCTLDCRHRGEWTIRVKNLMIYDLFGLFSFRVLHSPVTRKNFALSIYVTPVAYRFRKEPKDCFAESGSGESRRSVSESGDTFGDTRLYRAGDPLKRIHWAQTVRAREIYVRRFEQQESLSAAIVLDCAYLTREQETADIATETALSLLTCYEKNEIPARLICKRGNLTESTVTVRNQSDLQSATELLTRVRFSRGTDALPIGAARINGITRVGAVHFISALADDTTLSEAGRRSMAGMRTLVWIPTPAGKGNKKLPAPDPVRAKITLSGADDIIEKVGDRI